MHSLTFFSRSWRRPTPASWLLILIVVATIMVTPSFVIRWDWRDEVFDGLGLCLIVGGTLLTLVGCRREQEKPERAPLLAGVVAICAGVDFLIDASAQGVFWMVVFLYAVGLPLRRPWLLDTGDVQPDTTPRQPFAEWRAEALQCALRRGTLLCGIAALALVVEMLQDALAPGGPKAHALELGSFGSLLALVGVAWAAATDGVKAFSRKEQLLPFPYSELAARLLAAAATLFSLFALLAIVVQAPVLHAFDVSFGKLAYKCWGPEATQVIRKISNSGGRDLATLWIPVILPLLAICGRARSLRFFAAVMFGTLGLEVVFKGLSNRLRPEFTHGSHFDSFPSGHVLAATILAGTLLVLLIPSCRRPWQKGLLCAAATAWPLLMALSRVYTGRHYLTDVVGGMLLGSAWVCFSTGLFLSLVQAGFGQQRSPATGAAIDGEPA